MKFLLFVSDRDFSKPVIDFAHVLADQAHATINIHYVCKETKRERAEVSVERARQALGSAVAAVRIDEGIAIDKLKEEIERGGYDLVLIGAREEINYLQRKLTSLSWKVISESRIPVLVVRRPRTQFRKALICTGGMESAEKRIHAGVRLIQAAGAHADLLHVTGMVPSMYTGLNEMDEDLKKLLDSDTPVASNLRRGAEMLNEFELSGELHLRSGTVVETILREAEEGDYDLIVLGQTKANESVQGFLLGNVTRQVIEGAPCPVLVVR